MTSTPTRGTPQDGARALMRTLADSGIDTLFTNPGTTELHLVEAAEATPGLRSVLALFEGTVSGAADGFGRIAGRPRRCFTSAPARATPGPTSTTPAALAPRLSA